MTLRMRADGGQWIYQPDAPGRGSRTRGSEDTYDYQESRSTHRSSRRTHVEYDDGPRPPPRRRAPRRQSAAPPPEVHYVDDQPQPQQVIVVRKSAPPPVQVIHEQAPAPRVRYVDAGYDDQGYDEDHYVSRRRTVRREIDDEDIPARSRGDQIRDWLMRVEEEGTYRDPRTGRYYSVTIDKTTGQRYIERASPPGDDLMPVPVGKAPPPKDPPKPGHRSLLASIAGYGLLAGGGLLDLIALGGMVSHGSRIATANIAPMHNWANFSQAWPALIVGTGAAAAGIGILRVSKPKA